MFRDKKHCCCRSQCIIIIIKKKLLLHWCWRIIRPRPLFNEGSWDHKTRSLQNRSWDQGSSQDVDTKSCKRDETGMTQRSQETFVSLWMWRKLVGTSWLICSFLSHGQYIGATNAANANANVNVIYQQEAASHPASKHTVSDQTAQVHRLTLHIYIVLSVKKLISFLHFSMNLNQYSLQNYSCNLVTLQSSGKQRH